MTIATNEKEKRLDYLLLQDKKPKELPSFAPFIDEEFMHFRDKKFKKPVDEKEIKRKLKRTEKEAVRELRKDTTQIQI